tara:strand:+ start:380 stop:1543 length:1164 start_codon:yes stop_codon:yes gene_type:complete
MSTVINTRSPFYKKISNASLSYAKLELYVWTGVYADRVAASKKYTLTKEELGTNNYVTFELSELIRDYMITEYNDYATDTLWVNADITIYDSAGAIVQVGGQDTTIYPFLAIDGYGYFEDGINPRSVEYSTPMVMQDNNTDIYYYGGYDIKIPIYAEAATVTATLTSTAGANIFWENADEFWDTYDVTWGSGQTPVVITDNGNTNQKIQYLIITDTESLNDGDYVTISSTNASYPDVIIKLNKVCEPKFTPLSAIFYNKYGALQNLWFFKKSMTNISISSSKFKNNIIDFDNSGGSPSYSLSKHQEKIFMANGKESITMNTGFYDESFNEVIRQMLLSEQVWVYDGTNTLPINLKSNTLLFKKGVNDKLISYTVSFDYAYDKINNIQ